MCTALYQQCSRTLCQACSMVLFHIYRGFLCHSQTRCCGTRDFKKKIKSNMGKHGTRDFIRGEREWWGYCSKNFTGFTTNPSQNIWLDYCLTIFLKYGFEAVMLNHLFTVWDIKHNLLMTTIYVFAIKHQLCIVRCLINVWCLSTLSFLWIYNISSPLI